MAASAVPPAARPSVDHQGPHYRLVYDYESDDEVFSSALSDLASVHCPTSPSMGCPRTGSSIDEDTTDDEMAHHYVRPHDACPGPDEAIYDICLHCKFPYVACRLRIDRPPPVTFAWFEPLSEVLKVSLPSLRLAYDYELDMSRERRAAIERRASHQNTFVYCNDTGELLFVKHVEPRPQGELEYRACQYLRTFLPPDLEDTLLLPQHCVTRDDVAYLVLPFRRLWTLQDMKRGQLPQHLLYPPPSELELVWGVADLMRLFEVTDPQNPANNVVLYHGDLHARNVAFDYHLRRFCLFDFGNSEIRVRDPAHSSPYSAFVLGRQAAAMHDDWDKLKLLALDMLPQGPARDFLKKCFSSRSRRSDCYAMWTSYLIGASFARPSDPHAEWRREQALIVWLEAGARKHKLEVEDGLTHGAQVALPLYIEEVIKYRWFNDDRHVWPEHFVVPAAVNGPDDVLYLLKELNVSPGL